MQTIEEPGARSVRDASAKRYWRGRKRPPDHQAPDHQAPDHRVPADPDAQDIRPEGAHNTGAHNTGAHNTGARIGRDEAASYIATFLGQRSHVGQSAPELRADAIIMLAHRSGGVPRTLRSLTNLAMFAAKLEDAPCVTAAHIDDAWALHQETSDLGGEAADDASVDEFFAPHPAPADGHDPAAPRDASAVAAGRSTPVRGPVAPAAAFHDSAPEADEFEETGVPGAAASPSPVVAPGRPRRSLALIGVVAGALLGNGLWFLPRLLHPVIAPSERVAALQSPAQPFPGSLATDRQGLSPDAVAHPPVGDTATIASSQALPNRSPAPAMRGNSPPGGALPGGALPGGALPEGALPSGAAMHVAVVYPRGDAEASRRAASMVRTLREQGYDVAEPLEGAARAARKPGIDYFFAEDQPGAATIADRLGGGGAELQAAAPPLSGDGNAARPGTVRITLPPSAPPAGRGNRHGGA